MVSRYRVIKRKNKLMKQIDELNAILEEAEADKERASKSDAAAENKEEPIAAENDEDIEAYTLTAQDARDIKKMVKFFEHMTDLMLLRNRPVRFIWLNLLSGMAKGFGVALGITVIAFVAFKILTGLQILDLPIIGDFIAELIEYIDTVRDVI